MKVISIFIGLLAAISFVRTAGSEALSREMLFTLTKQKIASIDPMGNISKEECYDGMGISGQVEVRVPKQQFSIPAPNCRKNVMLRVGGVYQDKLYSNEKLDARWRLFQFLHVVLPS